MRAAILIGLLSLVGIGLDTGCHDFSREDVRLLETHGGLYIPSGEGFAARRAPVDAVILDASLTDAGFAEVFPVIARMDPYRLHLKGALSDKSVDSLNRLKSLRVLDASGTALTLDGFRRLRLPRLEQLTVPREMLTEEDVTALEEALPNVSIRR